MSKTVEEWRDIKGYEGLYQVNNEGRVKALEKTWVCGNRGSVRHQDEKIVAMLKCNKGGYIQVHLSCNHKRNTIPIHKLVAEAFIPNPNGYTVVHHIDHDPSNNKVENLVWMDKNEHNKMHAKERGEKLRGIPNPQHSKALKGRPNPKVAEKERNRKDLSKPCVQLTNNDEFVKIWPSTAEAARNGFHSGCISQCCNGKLKTHRKYKWMYLDDYEKMLEEQLILS